MILPEAMKREQDVTAISNLSKKESRLPKIKELGVHQARGNTQRNENVLCGLLFCVNNILL